MTTVASKPSLYTFNRYFAELVIYVKKAAPELKPELAKHYQVMENLHGAREHVDHFRSRVVDSEGVVDALLNAPTNAALTSPVVRDCEVLRGGIKLGHLLDKTTATSDCGVEILRRMYVLLALYGACSPSLSSDGDDEETTNKLGRVLSFLSNGGGGGDVDVHADGRQKNSTNEDDIISAALRKAGAGCDVRHQEKEKNAEDAQHDDFMRAFEGSKIGALAKEMVDEIDLSSLNIPDATEPSSQQQQQRPGNPLDMFNLQTLLDPNSGVGSMLAKMGSKMQHKVNSGEVRFDELMGEAMGMMNGGGGAAGMLQSNPLLKSLMQTMMAGRQGGGGQGGAPPAPQDAGMQGMQGMLAGLFNNATTGSNGGADDDSVNMDDVLARLDSRLQQQQQNPATTNTNANATKDRLRKKLEEGKGSNSSSNRRR